ncbi:TetR family transcriptional regulator [Nonomuraea fuscirosea]|uniref:TetR family transcriptional regulator n=1 Tax=Nonomuraea fuscirosea TaxID=1291556 RepID=A0A2T0N112_9ACTN|nr:TetR/AcrR family transcriptional regulator [Nonomuraea fuscirosea]PRX65504.1 TetR family transcriptional regulator [Nonomuraea fuscirosea]
MSTTRGRIDKRQAILDGAFTVFARHGYAQAGVEDVAREAGVAKPTVYNHMTDKATLFRHAMRAAAMDALDQRVAALAPLADPGDDLPATLEAVALTLLRLHTDSRYCALRSLLYSEITHFPDILDIVKEFGLDRVNQALADRLARLALAGRLRTTDPDLAAEQFMALVLGPLEARSQMGTRQLEEAELAGIARAAVETFARAWIVS